MGVEERPNAWQACDHPYLVVHGQYKGAKDVSKLPSRSKTEQAGDLCGLCQDIVEADNAALAGCKHIFHAQCIEDFLETVRRRPAPPLVHLFHPPLVHLFHPPRP
eukprot:COSAG01_NODE_5853_length_3992_cov_8.064475_5_plen_105_part_00